MLSLFTTLAFAVEPAPPPIVNGNITLEFVQVGAIMAYSEQYGGMSFCSGTFVNSRLLLWGQRSLFGLLIRSSDCSRFFGCVKTGDMNDSLDYRGSRNSSHGGA